MILLSRSRILPPDFLYLPACHPIVNQAELPFVLTDGLEPDGVTIFPRVMRHSIARWRCAWR